MLPIKWSVMFTTKTHVHVLGKFSNMYIVASFDPELLPDKLVLTNNAMVYTYHHRYLRSTYEELRNKLLNLKYELPVVRHNDSFECPICFEDSSIYTPLSCFHQLCSQCYVNIIQQKNKCPICAVPLTRNNELRKYFNNVPISQVLLAMGIIHLSDPNTIDYIMEIG